jgi:ribosomal protein L4
MLLKGLEEPPSVVMHLLNMNKTPGSTQRKTRREEKKGGKGRKMRREGGKEREEKGEANHWRMGVRIYNPTNQRAEAKENQKLEPSLSQTVLGGGEGKTTSICM